MNRRQLVLPAAGIVASALLGRLLAPLDMSDKAMGERLARLLAHADSARAVGQEYLRAMPAEAAPPRLTSLVVATLPRSRRWATDTQLRALLLDGIRKDFADERVVTVAGWVLSRTEARLYGLMYLVVPWV